MTQIIKHNVEQSNSHWSAGSCNMLERDDTIDWLAVRAGLTLHVRLCTCKPSLLCGEAAPRRAKRCEQPTRRRGSGSSQLSLDMAFTRSLRAGKMGKR